MTGTRHRGARAGALTLSAGAAAAGGLWYRRYTTPFPYAQRWMLDKELPYLTRARLLQVLAPVAGERMAEIGPGTGLFSLPVAERLAPDGLLDVVDIQPAMLEHTLRRARETEVTSIRATCADARGLPFPAATFDAVFMVTALGEIPDQHAALAEVRRVLVPGGRLVVGEFLVDWHAVPLGTLTRRARRHGLRLEARLGPRVSYLARFRRTRP
jgi:ubiquinone/menaquinone biosynthesis C-methylase UbiE